MLRIDHLIINKHPPVSLTIEAGECVGIAGDSGCGKSRLLRAIADLDEHDGNITLNDDDFQSMSGHAWRKKVAYLPTESQWWFDCVGEHFSHNDIPFESLGFTRDVLSWDIHRCSSGEKQRLSILRILANEPEVLLLDEPTANLDAENTQRVEQLLKNYINDKQIPVIWVSHNAEQLQRVAQSRYKMSQGELEKI